MSGARSGGANGLTFGHIFFAERLPNLPDSCAVIHGLDSTNVNRHDIARALIKGIVIGLARGMQRLVDFGISADELRISGGGAKSATMLQIVSDIFGLPVVGFKMIDGAALVLRSKQPKLIVKWKEKALQLKKIVNSTVKTDSKAPAEPRKENKTFYAESRERHIDFARKLASSGYL